VAQPSRKTTPTPGLGGQRARASIRWAPDLAALVAMALAGLTISGYLTTVHYAHVPLLCSAGGIVNCAQVTTSAYSVVPGTPIPITIPGILWFLVSGGLASAAWRKQVRTGIAPTRLGLAHLGWGAVGLITVLYLVYVEIVRLHAICEWCTAVHALTLLTFLVALYRVQQLPATAPLDDHED
jgi:uncharacterized membrane protein